MKKLLPLVLVALLVAFTVPAYGGALDYIFPQGNSVDGKIRLSKFVLDAEVTATADLYLTVMFQCFEPDSHAAARVFKCDTNTNNIYDPTLITCIYVDPADTIHNSFRSVTGIVQVNQAAGYMNNQGNAAAVAAVDDCEAYTKAEAIVTEVNSANKIRDPGYNHASIDDSFCSVTGMVQINQSPGSMNNQNNAAAIAAGSKGMVALADANLVQSNCGNRVENAGFGFLCNTNKICDSFGNVTGLVQVNQSAGSLNNQANVVAVSAVSASNNGKPSGGGGWH
jgi:hypothetical protein